MFLTLFQFLVLTLSLSISGNTKLDHDYYFYYKHYPPSFTQIQQWNDKGMTFNSSIVIKSKSKLFDSSLLIYDKNGIVHGFGDILYINNSQIYLQTSLHIVYKHPLSDWDILSKIIMIYLPFILLILLLFQCQYNKNIIVYTTFIPIYIQIFISPKILLSDLNFVFFSHFNRTFNGDSCNLIFNSHLFHKQDIFTSILNYTISLGIDPLKYGDFAFIKCDLNETIKVNNIRVVSPNFMKISDQYTPYKNWSIITPFYWPYINMSIQTFMDEMVFNGTNLYKDNKIPMFAKKLLNNKHNTAKKGFSYGIITVTDINDEYIYSLSGAYNRFQESMSGAKCILMNGNDGQIDKEHFIGYLTKPIDNHAKLSGNMCIRPNHPIYKQAYIRYIHSLKL